VSQDTQPYPWPAGSATGVGSMPGTDPAEAVAVVLGELPGFPHLPELPGRGPGADLTGRTAALLVGLAVETTTGGWKFAARPGRDQRRAAGFLQHDLDSLEQAAGGLDTALKIQVCGPWTMAATIELSRSQNPALADPGAVADLAESLAEGVAAHVAEVRKRVPAAPVLLQLDEPALPAVLAGSIPTASGLNRVPEVDAADTAAGLRTVLRASKAFGIVHCCAAEIPFQAIRDSGAGAVGFDLSLLRREDEDGLAEVAEAGLGILAGASTTMVKRELPAASAAPRDTAARVIELWHRIGLANPALAEQVVITPACGLAGESPAGARAALASCREAARILPELIEEGRR
jgi:methionine synthase II (cobalamin-independent)